MFLASLSYKQRKVFLGLAKEIILVDDGIIDDAEEAYLRGMCSEMALSYDDDNQIEKELLIKQFPEIEVRRVVLLELIALSYSNKVYHDSQNKFTDQIASLLEVPIKELRKFEELFENYQNIKNEFIKCIEQ